jgi:hypothetical protein
MTDKATDRELANFLIYHIKNPCVEPRTGLNIKEFYIREAERAIGTFNDSVAKTMLEESIHRYSTK